LAQGIAPASDALRTTSRSIGVRQFRGLFLFRWRALQMPLSVAPLFASKTVVTDEPRVRVCGMPGIVVYVLADRTAGVGMAANAAVSWHWQCESAQVERLA
jgi:hypothetical protein